MSIPVEIRRVACQLGRVACQLGRIIPCDSAYGQGPFWGLDEREIKS